MTYLKKENIFFERDGNGEVIPLEVTLESLPDKPKILITPLTKGELSKIVKMNGVETDIDTDIDIVITHCKNPEFKEEDREVLKKAGKTSIINAIAISIFSISTGVDQSKLLEEGKKKMAEKEMENFQVQ